MGKLSIILKASCSVVNSSVCCHISMPFVDQCLYHIDHTANFLRGKRMCSGRLYIHGCHILFTFCDITLADHGSIYAFLDRSFDDLIVHIGKVGYIINLIAFMLHIAAYRIKYDHRTCISDMDQVVYGRTADIHTDLSFFDRYKFLFCFCKRIINPHVKLLS